jgi:enoyl-CoA hydratase
VGGTVLYERDGAVATLTLSRPERLNAIVPEQIDDVEAALDGAEEDPGTPWDPIADHR